MSHEETQGIVMSRREACEDHSHRLERLLPGSASCSNGKEGEVYVAIIQAANEERKMLKYVYHMLRSVCVCDCVCLLAATRTKS